MLGQRFLDRLVLEPRVGEQLDGVDVGVAVDDAAGQRRTCLGVGGGEVLHLRHEVPQRRRIEDQPDGQRDGQPPVGLGEQIGGGTGVDQHEPDGVDQLHGAVTQRAAGLDDLVGDAAGEVVVEGAKALPQHMPVGLPANERGEVGDDHLVLDEVMEAERERPGDQRDKAHPEQQQPVLLKEVLRRAGVLHQVDQLADVGKQRHLDDGADEAGSDEDREPRPHLPEVVEIERCQARAAVSPAHRRTDRSGFRTSGTWRRPFGARALAAPEMTLRDWVT